MHRIAAIGAVGVAMLLAGCASAPNVFVDEADAPPPDQRVTLRGSFGASTNHFVNMFRGMAIVNVQTIDGKAPIVDLGVLERGARTVYMLPGKHTIGMQWTEHRGTRVWRAKGEAWFVGEAGRTYRIVAERVAYDAIQFWIEDEKTGARVGGIPGSADEPR